MNRHEKQRDPPSSCFRWVSSACILANKGQRMSLKSQKENKRGKGRENSDSQMMRKWVVMQVRRTTRGFFNKGCEEHGQFGRDKQFKIVSWEVSGLKYEGEGGSWACRCMANDIKGG